MDFPNEGIKYRITDARANNNNSSVVETPKITIIALRCIWEAHLHESFWFYSKNSGLKIGLSFILSIYNSLSPFGSIPVPFADTLQYTLRHSTLSVCITQTYFALNFEVYLVYNKLISYSCTSSINDFINSKLTPKFLPQLAARENGPGSSSRKLFCWLKYFLYFHKYFEFWILQEKQEIDLYVILNSRTITISAKVARLTRSAKRSGIFLACVSRISHLTMTQKEQCSRVWCRLKRLVAELARCTNERSLERRVGRARQINGTGEMTEGRIRRALSAQLCPSRYFSRGNG